MSREQDSTHSDDRFEKKLAELRDDLEKAGQLTPGIERLIQDLSLIGQSRSFPQEGNEMLSVIVSEALKGVDIGTRYPYYYKMLLLDEELRQAFLDALDILVEDQGEEQYPEMETTYPDLSFLQRQSPAHRIERFEGKGWRIIWRQAAEQLQNLFFENNHGHFAYRIAENYLEENWMPMIRDEIEVDGVRYGVYLEVSTIDIIPESLELALAVTLTPSLVDVAAMPSKLRANISWGDYVETVTFTEEDRATFPPLPLAMILDGSGQKISPDLQLTLEPA